MLLGGTYLPTFWTITAYRRRELRLLVRLWELIEEEAVLE